MWIWTLLTVFVVLFELWYAAAFVYAYAQIRERPMLLPAAQALLILAAFVYLTAAVLSGWQINPFIVLGLLIAAMLVSLLWRRAPGGLTALLRSYPRGTLDVLSFRRPAVDLKRRVRTK